MPFRGFDGLPPGNCQANLVYSHSCGTPAISVPSRVLHNKVLPVRCVNQIVYDKLGFMVSVLYENGKDT